MTAHTHSTGHIIMQGLGVTWAGGRVTLWLGRRHWHLGGRRR